MRVVVMLVVGVLAICLGAFIYAKYELTSRVAELAGEARSLCNAGRGGALPDQEKMADRFVSLADERRLLVDGVRISFEPLDGADGVAGQLQGTLAAASGGKLKMEATQVTIEAGVRGKKWLWSVERDVSSKCTMQGSVKRVGAP